MVCLLCYSNSCVFTSQSSLQCINDVAGEAPVGVQDEHGDDSDHPNMSDTGRSSGSKRSKNSSKNNAEGDREKKEQTELRDVVDRKSVHLNAVRLKYNQVRILPSCPIIISHLFSFRSARCTMRASHLPACLRSF